METVSIIRWVLLGILMCCVGALPLKLYAEEVELQNAVIVRFAPGEPGVKTASMLRDEFEKRSGARLRIERNLPESGRTAIVLATKDTVPAEINLPQSVIAPPEKAEAYSISVDTTSRQAPTIWCIGYDSRGTLFAAGKLVRVAHYRIGKITIPSSVRISTSPEYPIRGHQLGYRNTANSYDAWDVATYEQYIRDLILFGTNGIELIPSFDPELVDGPVMKRKMWEMNVDLANLIASYGLMVMFWVPALEDLSKPEEAEKALEIRRAIFQSCQRIDVVLVPGGDDGDNPAEYLMPWLERMAPILHEIHPEAQLWVSNQTFEHEENEYFFKYLQEKQPRWLTGVAFGPWIKTTMEVVRERTPKSYLLRHYPDITHCVRCQYPVPDWDRAFAHTLGREPICPRPFAMGHIHNRFAPLTSGFVTYSDGIHDDLNKFIWTVLGWNSKEKIEEIVRDYAKTFFGEEVSEEVARGLFMLEENWRGPIATNKTIEKTLALWQKIASENPEMVKENWRLQMYLFRAYYDAYVQKKAETERQVEQKAYAALRRVNELGVREAVLLAMKEFAVLDENPPAAELRTEIEKLGRSLLDSIGFQLSVKEPYLAKNPERGAVLDWLDQPLNDRPWLEQQFKHILVTKEENKQRTLLDQILNWENAGEGGFYDDLGNPERQPHLVKFHSWEKDPGFVGSPQCEYTTSNLRLSWQDQAQTLFGTPLIVRYEKLDPTASYKIRVTYAGRFRATMTLKANDVYDIHGPLSQPDPIKPLEFDIPHEATAEGTLTLRWDLVEGRGCQVAEVWLIKK